MPYCPNCRSEYREGYTECKNCQVNLVDELPPIDEEVLTPKRELPWVKYLRIEYIPILCALATMIYTAYSAIMSTYSMLTMLFPTGEHWMALINLNQLPTLFLYAFILLVFLYRLLGKEFGYKRLFYRISLVAYLVLFAFWAVGFVWSIPHLYQSSAADWGRTLLSDFIVLGSPLALIFFFIGRLRGWTKSLKVWTYVYLGIAVLNIVKRMIPHGFKYTLLFFIANAVAVLFLMFLDRAVLDKCKKQKHAEFVKNQYSPESQNT